MPTGTFVYRTEAERRAIEHAIAFVTELHQLALDAPDGQVLPACEQQALGRGRDLLRAALEHAVQARVERAEEKGGPPAPARAAARSAASGGVTARC
jgi:hypothetical protein